MNQPSLVALVRTVAAVCLCFTAVSKAAEPAVVPFEGEKGTWHDGFDRYDFVMDGETMAVTPFKRPAGERFGVGGPPAGGRRCVVVCPKTPAAGNPWSWRGCYWDHQPQTEVELLRRGFHVCYISADASLKPDKYWDAWYAYVTEKHGLSRKPAFIGMSRGGEYAFTWATAHPDYVSAIYADNPGGNDEAMRRLGDLAKQDVPVLLVSGTIDPILQKYTVPIESLYQQAGGRVSVMLKDGAAHHPHSLNDPTPLADFIERSARETPPAAPDFVAGKRFVRSAFYGTAGVYEKSSREPYYITRRGPAFAPSYDRYDVWLGFDMPTTVITPRKEAAGKPWVYRAGHVGRDATVDLALLAKGFHVVVGPVGFNNDGPKPAEWGKLYTFLTEHGFARKPVLEGAGGAAGAVYAWAVENPDKVSCVYAENPVLRTDGVKVQPLDNLAPLAKAGVPLLHVCGGLEPALDDQTRIAEKRYKDLGGSLTVIVLDGEGHFAGGPKDVKPVVDFILRQQDAKPAKETGDAKDAKEPKAAAGKYDFDRMISRPVLESYLDRSICMEGMFNGRGDFDDHVRMLKATGAKYIARSICLWGGEANLLKTFDRARELVPKARAADPDMVFEACIFEIVTRQVDQVPVPEWAFTELGLKPEPRNFRYEDMTYTDARRQRQWGGNGSVPDVSRPETLMWFYFLARSYVDLGFEAIHYGQVELMNKNDRDLAHYADVLGRARSYAAGHARRHLLLCNAHTPGGGFVRDGKLLLDFHAFPMRVMETPDKPDKPDKPDPAQADKPQEAILKVGHSDGLYGRSKGGVSPSGWDCDHLPYLVELDNYGSSPKPGEPGEPGAGGIWIWGYDEITWFAHQPPDYRAKWLRYAWDWVRQTDPACHMEMPGSRTMRSPRDGKRWYYANKASPAVPEGLGDEVAIAEIWAGDGKSGRQ